MGLTSIWPPLPIIITDIYEKFISENYDFHAAIAYHNRVCEINLINLASLQLERLASAMMQVQFPALIHLSLEFDDFATRGPALPDEFLSGSVPCLQSLKLHSITFPGLPKLLLSITHLVSLTLLNIPDSGYFSPKSIVTNLAVLANLKFLTIEFEIEFESLLSRSDPESRRPPPPTRAILPALTHFKFQGISEYLDDLVAQIDAPLLDFISVTFFHGLIFDTPQLARFMRRMTRFQALNEAHVDFYVDPMFYWGVQIGSLPLTQTSDDKSKLRIICDESDGLLSSLAQVCLSFFPSIYTVEHLYLYGMPQMLQNHVANMPWLDILHPFAAVKSLYLSRMFAQFIALALLDLVEEGVTEVLPTLESLFLEDPHPSGFVEEVIGNFVAVRQLSGHPVAISHWKRGAL